MGFRKRRRIVPANDQVIQPAFRNPLGQLLQHPQVLASAGKNVRLNLLGQALFQLFQLLGFLFVQQLQFLPVPEFPPAKNLGPILGVVGRFGRPAL